MTRSIPKCEICGIRLLNGNNRTRYCKTDAAVMHEVNRFKRIQRSSGYQRIPKKYKVHCDPANECNQPKD